MYIVGVKGVLTVDVTADARRSGSLLAVLAPHAVRRLGVCEAIWVHNGEDVEVV